MICIGAGGLAASTLLYLCAAGIGTIGIIDNDYVEISNLHRQVIYNLYHLNQLKIKCAKQELLKINPQCNINIYNTILSRDNSITIMVRVNKKNFIFFICGTIIFIESICHSDATY